ncbi:MAG: hypothetical protein H6838_09325 [Planctomycetes bacterium]|nr:hypothetical protein [Planctomycetota bacterium]
MHKSIAISAVVLFLSAATAVGQGLVPPDIQVPPEIQQPPEVQPPPPVEEPAPEPVPEPDPVVEPDPPAEQPADDSGAGAGGCEHKLGKAIKALRDNDCNRREMIREQIELHKQRMRARHERMREAAKAKGHGHR